jgi:type VI protein secretion system component VasF
MARPLQDRPASYPTTDRSGRSNRPSGSGRSYRPPEEPEERPAMHLTAACWPVFEFVINFARQMKGGAEPEPEQTRYEALAALRDADDIVRDDLAAERAWNERVKAMMVYFLDYKMLNTTWNGRDHWFNNRFEIDREIMDHAEALGGYLFFEECDELQKEYEVADRRERPDRHELAEQLSLYYTCLRLGFKGKYHDQPQALGDYTRRLFTRLPAHALTRGKEMFPEAYRHNQEVKVDYKLGMRLTMVLTIFVLILVGSAISFRWAWSIATRDIAKAADDVKSGIYFNPPGQSPGEGESSQKGGRP